MDFMSDQLYSGRRIRSLNIVDDFTRECLHIEVDSSLPSQRVIQVLEWLKELHGLPEQIVMDNGTEFTSLAMDKWFYRNKGTSACFIDPGKPNQNAYIESFNSKFRDECLNQNWFTNLEDAQMTVEQWREDYNTVRPHSSLGYMTPREYAASQASLRSAPPPSGCPENNEKCLTNVVSGLT
jgi:putative transposase